MSDVDYLRCVNEKDVFPGDMRVSDMSNEIQHHVRYDLSCVCNGCDHSTKHVPAMMIVGVE